MVYVSNIEDNHALIFDGATIYNEMDPKIITSSDLNDIKDLWEFNFLPDKEGEWPALKHNAIDALQRIESHITPAGERKILDFGSGWGFSLLPPGSTTGSHMGWSLYPRAPSMPGQS